MLPAKEVNTRTGNLVIHSEDSIIGRSIENYGEYCWPEIELIKSHIEPNDFMIDVGAGVGTHSVALGPHCGKVLSIEADNKNHDLLVKNLAINMCKNITPNHMALGSEFKKVGTNFNYSKTTITDNGDVIMTALDNIQGFPAVNLIKVSANGMELPILMGAKNTMSYFKCQVVVDVSDKASKPFIIDYLRGLNYNVYEFKCPLFTTANHKRNSKNLFGDAVKDIIFATFTEPNSRLTQV